MHYTFIDDVTSTRSAGRRVLVLLGALSLATGAQAQEAAVDATESNAPPEQDPVDAEETGDGKADDNGDGESSAADAGAQGGADAAEPAGAEPADAEPADAALADTTAVNAPDASPQASAPPFRLELGGRAGYAIPMGDSVDGSPLKDLVAAAIPVQFDGWLRHSGGTALGLYVQAGPGLKGEALKDCSDCSAFEIRAGIQLVHHFNNGGMVDPWLGLGLGYEQLYSSRDTTLVGIDSAGNIVEVDGTRSLILKAAPEFLLQAGIDFGSKDLAFGPYVAARYSTFSDVEAKVTCDDLRCPDTASFSDEDSISDDSQSSHVWLQFGLRGTYLR